MNTHHCAIDKETGKYTIPTHALKHVKYACFDCGNDVIVKQGGIRTHHFAHCAETAKCTAYNHHTETQQHKYAKQILKNALDNNYPINIQRKCANSLSSSCEEYDEFIIPETDETTQIVIEHGFTYNNGRKQADVAFLGENEEIICIFEICHTHKTEETDRPELWFEFNAMEVINKIHEYMDKQMEPDASILLDCIRKLNCDDCVTASLPKGIIFFNQRGAGSGKTYESIQLIQNDERFKEKSTYIYLTQMHSAKDVILNEFEEQYKRGHLSSLEWCDKIVGKTFGESLGVSVDVLKKMEKSTNNGNPQKQHTMTFKRKSADNEINVIIGTIDSFNWAVVNKNKITKHNNYFRGIVKSIEKGHFTATGQIQYARQTHELNNDCLIIIDEAQDLIKDYICAFNTIIQRTNIDVYVIGDKLQSISNEHNILTTFDTNNLPNRNIIRNIGINKVMRFHNRQFIDFVNCAIPFEKYGLHPITEICGGGDCCKYIHEDHKKPYNVFEIPNIYDYGTGFNYEKMDGIIETLIDYMEIEINEYGYLPKHFMFIFPILSRNVFATTIETRIQDFWIKKFNDAKYRETVLEKDDYWKDKIHNGSSPHNFHKYIYLHKSETGKSINLKESENATRILSIHASKGNGCEVVFVLGMTEKSLTIFSNTKGNLIYDSLLHVAITRQKKSIYIGVEKNNDDIYCRLTKMGVTKDDTIEPNLSIISKNVKMSRIKNFVNCDDKENTDLFLKISEEIIEPNNYRQYLPIQSTKNGIIDWGHHTVRYDVMKYYMLLHLTTDDSICEDQLNKDQFITILRKLKEKDIVTLKYNQYIQALQKIANDKHKIINDKKTGKTAGKNGDNRLPILLFGEDNDEGKYESQYKKYTRILKEMMESIQQKLPGMGTNKKITLPQLCPLECVILLFMTEIAQKGINSTVSIMEIYSIMYCYDSCSNSLDDKHTAKHGCLCQSSFNEGGKWDECGDCGDDDKNEMTYLEFRKSIKNHYDIVGSIKRKYDEYKHILKEKYQIENVKYNIEQSVRYAKNNVTDENFYMSSNFTIIGQNDTSVVYFVIKPQFNELNFGGVICDSILDNFIIANCGYETETVLAPPQHKFYGKRIYTCILTFDTVLPTIIELNIDKNNAIVKEIVKKYMMDTYINHIDVIHEYYILCDKRRPKDISSVKYTMNKLNDDGKHLYLPKYINDYFYDVEKKIKTSANKETIKNILTEVKDLNVMKRKMTELIETKVDEFLGLTESVEIDY
jgi:hypothetical protein